MDQADSQKVVRAFLAHLVGLNITEPDAYAVYVPSFDRYDGWEDGPIEVVVVCSAFGQDPLQEGRALWAAVWAVDPRIQPVGVSPEQWAAAEESPILLRASLKGEKIQTE